VAQALATSPAANAHSMFAAVTQVGARVCKGALAHTPPLVPVPVPVPDPYPDPSPNPGGVVRLAFAGLGVVHVVDGSPVGGVYVQGLLGPQRASALDPSVFVRDHPP
jgi:hypothetical protein